MEENYSYCQIIGLTDRGLKRAANEDWLGEKKTVNGWVSVVCDGMGGHVGGATASHIGVETILAFLTDNYFEDARVAIGRAIDEANAAIRRYAASHPELSGMGSTCVLLIVRDGKVYLGHVGDSRIYLIRDHRIHQLTKDHSYVQMLVDAGQLTPEEAEKHPRKNEITNALGIEQMQPATVMSNAIEPLAGDCFLLCSDGLSGMVSDKVIERIISQQQQKGAQARVQELIDKAKENGGLDNITAQVVEFGTTPADSVSTTDKKKKVLLWSSIACVLLLVVGGILFWLLSKPTPATETTETTEEATTEEPPQAIVQRDTLRINKITLKKNNQGAVAVLGFTQQDEWYLLVVKTIDGRTIGPDVITYTHPDSIRGYQGVATRRQDSANITTISLYPIVDSKRISFQVVTKEHIYVFNAKIEAQNGNGGRGGGQNLQSVRSTNQQNNNGTSSGDINVLGDGLASSTGQQPEAPARERSSETTETNNSGNNTEQDTSPQGDPEEEQQEEKTEEEQNQQGNQ